jgi:ABC-type antimicrobial peptide transport system permease subunit
LVLREVAFLLGAGLTIGVPGALLLSRYVSAQLFGVTPADLSIWITTVLILSVVAAAAGSMPARRAASIDPITALHYE